MVRVAMVTANGVRQPDPAVVAGRSFSTGEDFGTECEVEFKRADPVTLADLIKRLKEKGVI